MSNTLTIQDIKNNPQNLMIGCAITALGVGGIILISKKVIGFIEENPSLFWGTCLLGCPFLAAWHFHKEKGADGSHHKVVDFLRTYVTQNPADVQGIKRLKLAAKTLGDDEATEFLKESLANFRAQPRSAPRQVIRNVPTVKPNRRSRIQVPDSAFGPQGWMECFGDVGEVPPLPEKIPEILKSDCPFWPGKRIEETHFLFLLPKTVNKAPLTLNSFREIIQNPRKGSGTRYSWYADEVRLELGDEPLERSHWLLLTKTSIPDLLGKPYGFQQRYFEKNAQYEMAKAIQVTVMMHTYYQKTGEFLFEEKKYGEKWTRCEDQVEKWYNDGRSMGIFPVEIGCMNKDKFCLIGGNIDGKVQGEFGVVGVRKLGI